MLAAAGICLFMNLRLSQLPVSESKQRDLRRAHHECNVARPGHGVKARSSSEKLLRKRSIRGVYRNKEIEIRVLMRKPSSLSSDDAAKQEQNLEAMRALLGDAVQVRFCDAVEIRGCIIDPNSDGRALFLVEEEGVPLFLREAALTSHPGVAKALGSMFELKWRFDSE